MMQQKITRKQINYGDETQGRLLKDTDVDPKDWKHFSNYGLEQTSIVKISYILCCLFNQ